MSEPDPRDELIAELQARVRGLEEQFSGERTKREPYAPGNAQPSDLSSGRTQPRDFDEEQRKLLEERDQLAKALHQRREGIRLFLEQHPTLPVHEKSPLVARLAQLDADARKLVWEQVDEKPG